MATDDVILLEIIAVGIMHYRQNSAGKGPTTGQLYNHSDFCRVVNMIKFTVANIKNFYETLLDKGNPTFCKMVISLLCTYKASTVRDPFVSHLGPFCFGKQEGEGWGIYLHSLEACSVHLNETAYSTF